MERGPENYDTWLDRSIERLQQKAAEQRQRAEDAERGAEWRRRAEKAEAKVKAVRDLCDHVMHCWEEDGDTPFPRIEDPTPLPGWVTLVRRAIGDER